MAQAEARATFVDDFLPDYDFSDTIETMVAADASTTWDALVDTDLIELGRQRRLIGVLGAARILPDLLWQRVHGEHPPTAPERLTLREMTALPVARGRWVLLRDRPPQEIALGSVGKFWRPVIEYADVDAGAFQDFSTPGYAKTVAALGTRPQDDGTTLLWATMQTSTTDEHAREWFRRYWTLGINYGAHVLLHGLLDHVRKQAERTRGTRAAAGQEQR